MNQTIARIGAITVTITVALFAALLPVSTFGSCFVCIFLALGYLLLLAGFHSESCEERKAAATAGLLFGCIYAVLILLVYFTQLTAVKNDPLNEQSAMLLDFSKGGLFFGYDLLGYGMMALSTFFTGLTLRPEDRKDKWLKCLMMLHGVFFFGCLLMPMTGIFRTAMSDGSSPGGIIVLECWCAYFLPISVLSALHFKKAS